MARVSRPPGFDMTYKPAGTVSFGPPIKERIPSLVYFGAALLAAALVGIGHVSPVGSWLHNYVVAQDIFRIVSIDYCVGFLVVSALAAVLRSKMRGVVVRPEGIEMRELLPLGLPRIRRFTWAQIDRVMVPTAKAAPDDIPRSRHHLIGLDLWDGSTTWLPHVARLEELALMVEKVALARAIPIDGGTGMIDDLEAFAAQD